MRVGGSGGDKLSSGFFLLLSGLISPKRQKKYKKKIQKKSVIFSIFPTTTKIQKLFELYPRTFLM